MNDVRYGLARYAMSTVRSPGRVLNLLGRPRFMLNRLLGLMGFGYRFTDLARIVLYVTTACNMRCAMCDIGQGNKRGIDHLRETQEHPYFSLDLLNRLLNDPYVRRRKLFFDLKIAEPLLHPDICEIVRLIKESGHTVQMATNGYLLPDKAEELLNAGLDFITVSIDGPEKVHDSIRGANGAYRNAIDGLRILNQDRNLRIDVLYVISCLNDSEILNFFDAIGAEGIRIDLLKLQFMNFVSKEMRMKQNEEYEIKTTESSISDTVDPGKVNIAELHRQLDSIRSIKDRYENIRNLTIIPNLRSEKQIAQYFDTAGNKIKGNSKCTWPWERLVLTTDGRALIHTRCLDFCHGDFNQNSIGEIFHDDRIRSFRKEFRDLDYCYPACTRCCGVMLHGLLF
jgi:MoaA/NifB/PqqE/SkfB family radical SAM enzyme